MLSNQFRRDAEYNVVIYARMSTDSQNPRSPDQQIDTINAALDRLRLPWKVVAVYRDDGKSGRYSHKRPQYEKMLRDFKSKAVVAQLLLVDTFERLSRADNNAEVRSRLKKSGVLVLTADSEFQDPTTVSGRALSMVESIRATEEGRVKAHNVLRGKKDAVRLGHWPGGTVPFGFRLRNVMVVRGGVEEADYRVLEPVESLRPLIMRIFTLAAERAWGGHRICKALNDDDDVPDELKPFLAPTIAYLLGNELYYGELVWGKNCTGIVDDTRVLQSLPEAEWVRHPGFCEAIISRELWDQAQQVRQERRRRRAAEGTQAGIEEIAGLRAPGVALKYPLSGLVVCAACGKSMIASSGAAYVTKAGEERRYVAYVCPAYHSGACSNGKRIPEDWLCETVMNLVRERLFLTPVEEP